MTESCWYTFLYMTESCWYTFLYMTESCWYTFLYDISLKALILYMEQPLGKKV